MKLRMVWWDVAALVAFGIAGLGALGEWLGWWHWFGEVVIWTSTIAGLILAFNGASRRSIDRLHDPLSKIADELATIRVVIDRLVTPAHHRASEGSP